MTAAIETDEVIGRARVLGGDCREIVRTLESESVNCVVTSPPYWGLRDYGYGGQMGMERTLGEHIAALVDLFRDVRRVLRPDATVWLNYGDCYASSPNGRPAAAVNATGADDRTFRDKPFSTVGPIYDPGGGARGGGPRGANKGNAAGAASGRVVGGGTLKPKDLCMVSNRLAIALQDDGWWVRSEIVWHKPNPMPESAKDRPTCAHEKIWLLTKSARYHYDADAVRTAAAESSIARWAQNIDAQAGSSRANGGVRADRPMKAVGGPRADKQRGHSRRHAGFNDRWDRMTVAEQRANGANLRNVWSIATEPYRGAHFATFPRKIVEPCIKAGCPPGGVVLDPFAGTGTVGVVADILGRNAILIEANPEYVEAHIRRRLSALRGGDAGLFARGAG